MLGGDGGPWRCIRGPGRRPSGGSDLMLYVSDTCRTKIAIAPRKASARPGCVEAHRSPVAITLSATRPCRASRRLASASVGKCRPRPAAPARTRNKSARPRPKRPGRTRQAFPPSAGRVRAEAPRPGEVSVHAGLLREPTRSAADLARGSRRLASGPRVGVLFRQHRRSGRRPMFRSRVGGLLAVPRDGRQMLWRRTGNEDLYRGGHGGWSPEEMWIPLVCVRV